MLFRSLMPFRSAIALALWHMHRTTKHVRRIFASSPAHSGGRLARALGYTCRTVHAALCQQGPSCKLIDVATKEVARTTILETLEEAGITGCSTQVLTQVLNKSKIEADIENTLFYLESKELVRCKNYENARQGIKRTVYFITEKGIDFLDGNVAETGLADD